MRPAGILHPELLEDLVRAGHGDVVVLADAGLRVPRSARRIDLGLRCGVPTVAETLEAVLGDLVVEGAVVATELTEWNPDVERTIVGLLGFEPRRLPHADFAQEMAETAYAYVRTGDCSAFACVALVCGVSYYKEAVALKERLDRERGR